MARIRPREGELPLHIDGSEDVPLGAVHESDDRVELHTAFLLPPPFQRAFPGLCVVRSGRGSERELLPAREEAAPLEVGETAPDV